MAFTTVHSGFLLAKSFLFPPRRVVNHGWEEVAWQGRHVVVGLLRNDGDAEMEKISWD